MKVHKTNVVPVPFISNLKYIPVMTVNIQYRYVIQDPKLAN
jgi:hypothetical protein